MAITEPHAGAEAAQPPLTTNHAVEYARERIMMENMTHETASQLLELIRERSVPEDLEIALWLKEYLGKTPAGVAHRSHIIHLFAFKFCEREWDESPLFVIHEPPPRVMWN